MSLLELLVRLGSFACICPAFSWLPFCPPDMTASSRLASDSAHGVRRFGLLSPSHRATLHLTSWTFWFSLFLHHLHPRRLACRTRSDDVYSHHQTTKRTLTRHPPKGVHLLTKEMSPQLWRPTLHQKKKTQGALSPKRSNGWNNVVTGQQRESHRDHQLMGSTRTKPLTWFCFLCFFLLPPPRLLLEDRCVSASLFGDRLLLPRRSHLCPEKLPPCSDLSPFARP